MLRILDTTLAALGLSLSFPVLLLLLLFGYFDTGSPLFFQRRVGRHRQTFTLVKFRTMRVETTSIATHLADANAVTSLGRILRKTKLDELPQLWNVLRGEMSLVGPRPCLPSQRDLIKYRDQLHIFNVRPGITGLAQINGIDMATPELLAQTDAKMLSDLSAASYFKIIALTILGKGAGDRVKD